MQCTRTAVHNTRMRYMVTLTPKSDSTDAIRGLVGAEQQRVAELRQAGVVEQLYVSRPG